MQPHPSANRRGFAWALLAVLLLSVGATAQKFCDDDPLERMPRPRNVDNIKGRKLSDYYDFFLNTFGKPGERHTKQKQIPAQGVNTLGEVPDCEWYTNRHYHNPMTIEELVRGAGDENAPDSSGTLTVISAKTEGISPGFTIRDARGRKYFVKFDPKTNPEMATAADVISSKFFHALGYSVPQNYIFMFRREQLVVAPDATFKDSQGKQRPMREKDVTDLLLDVPRHPGSGYRAIASFCLSGTPVGPFRYHGTRKDDPNDIVPHEHRRDLRGLRVFCAWLAHEDAKSLNTLDVLVEGDGIKYLRHCLIDFGATLGSRSIGPKSPLWGNEYLFDFKHAALQMFTLGLHVPRWMTADYPHVPAVGRYEAEVFDPEKWVPHYRNPAFSNSLPDDAFWAAKQVMAFTDEEIRAIVKTGEYSDPRAEDWIVECLIKRRDKIGRAYFAKVLPLDRFAVTDGRLVFEDLAVKHGFAASQDYRVQWFRFNNDTGEETLLAGENTFALPRQVKDAATGEYFTIDISSDDKKKTVTVYVRKESAQIKVVGIDRSW